jgi:hypothetical protein
MKRWRRGPWPLAVLLAVTAFVGGCKRAHEILPPGSRVGYYVAEGGTPGGDGTDGSPWDLETALDGASGVIQPGDTVWVRGGTYLGPFTSTLTGNAPNHIIVRAYPGERAIIDGKDTPNDGSEILTVDGAFTTYWGLEITNTVTQRTDTRHSGVYLRNAQNVKLVNLIIHDTGMGVFGEPDARGCEVYGAIIYNGGWQTATRSNGHALYMKGDAAGSKIIRNNIMFNMFGLGFHAYADAGTGPLDNMTIEGNIIFNSGTLSDYTSSNILVGGEDAADNITIQNNYTYFSPGLGNYNVRLGYQSTANGSLTFSGNYLVGAGPVVEVRFWNDVTVQGNTMQGAATIVDFRDDSNAGYSWTNNNFYRDSTSSAWRWGGTAYTLPNWRTQSGGLGGGDRGLGATTTTSVAVIPNAYESGRAHIVVYNWGNLTNAPVNVGGLLSSGDHYEVRNVQNLFGSPVASGTYNGGGTITVPLGGVAPTPPIGGSPVAPVQTGPAFNAFLLTKS